MSIRSQGTINISVNGGLFKIPLKVYPFTKDESSPFHNGCSTCGTRIQKPNFCPKCNKQVSSEQLLKLFQVGDDISISIPKKAVEDLKEKHKHCEFLQVIPKGTYEMEISVATEKVLWLAPEKNFEDVYAVLMEALKQSGSRALINFHLRDRTNLGLIEYWAEQNILILRKLRYAELFGEKPVFNYVKPNPNVVGQMTTLLNALTNTNKLVDYKDDYARELVSLVRDNPNDITQIGTAQIPDANALQNALALAIQSIGSSKGTSKEKEAE